MSKILCCAAVLCLLGLAGCGRSQQVVSSDPICLAVSGAQATKAAATVLEEMHFSLEKDDPEVGYIRTRPLTAAQFFQFWRQDNADAYMTSQANMQSLRRVVEMEFYPRGQTVCINCRVQVQRLSLPERPIEGIHNAAASFTDSRQSRQTIAIENEQLEKMEWLDAGLDRALEQKILKRVQRKIQKGLAR